MTRPCTCNRGIDQPTPKGSCRLCWLYFNDPRYHQLWEDSPEQSGSFVFPDDVAGWLTEEEGQALANLAASRSVLEIGSFKGRSTICMAQTARHMHSVDWHKGGPEMGCQDSEAHLRTNLARHRVTERVTVVVARIEDAANELPGGFDLAFIDGDHESASVRRDTEIAEQLLKPWGVLAWHDFNQDRVSKAVRSLGYSPNIVAGSIAVAVNRFQRKES